MLTAQKLDYAKFAIKFVAGSGVAKIVHSIIDDHMMPESTYETIAKWTGTFVITSMINDRASTHIDTKIDLLADWCVKTKAEYHAQK